MFKTPPSTLRVKVGAYGVALGCGLRKSPTLGPRFPASYEHDRAIWHRLTGFRPDENVWVAWRSDPTTVAGALRRMFRGTALEHRLRAYDLARHLVR